MADEQKKYLDQTGLARLVANMNLAYAPADHDHVVADITDLTATATELNYMDGVTSNVQTQLNGKAASGHTHSAYVNQNAFSNVVVGSTTIAADSATDTLTLVAGSNVTLTPDESGDSITIAAKDTTYSDATTSAHGLMTAAMVTKLNGIAAGAQVNQNAFSKVTVGSTTVEADNATDTLTLVAGTNVTITPDATNDKITITAKDTTYSAATTSAPGLMSAADKTKLDGIATGANKYTLPVAGSALGGVKSGTDITVDSSGNVSVNNDSHSHSASTITSVNASAITGVIAAANLPSYVDDVIEGYYSSSKFYKTKGSDGTYSSEITGESGKIYVDLNTNKTYRWSGSAYAVISETLALGETSSTAYRGDRGATAYTHATSDTGKALSSGLYKITTSARGHVTAGTAVTKADITGLGIPAQDTVYTHPTSSGNKHIPSGGSAGQFLKWSADGTAVWAADNNTWNALKGATATAAGTAGYVAAPAKGQQGYFLRGDATWAALTKSTVGLGNVDNTADADKSVKYATSAGSATNATYVKDSLSGGNLTITYAKDGQSSTSWLASWNGTELGCISPSNVTVGRAASATKATQDSAGQQINTTYIKGLSVSGRTITITKGNNTTTTITTQDTTYAAMTNDEIDAAFTEVFGS